MVILFMLGFVVKHVGHGVCVFNDGATKVYWHDTFGTGEVITVGTCKLVTLLVEQPTVKLVELVTVNIGTPTDAVTFTDLVTGHPVTRSVPIPQYIPG